MSTPRLSYEPVPLSFSRDQQEYLQRMLNKIQLAMNAYADAIDELEAANEALEARTAELEAWKGIARRIKFQTVAQDPINPEIGEVWCNENAGRGSFNFYGEHLLDSATSGPAWYRVNMEKRP